MQLLDFLAPREVFVLWQTCRWMAPCFDLPVVWKNLYYRCLPARRDVRRVAAHNLTHHGPIMWSCTGELVPETGDAPHPRFTDLRYLHYPARACRHMEHYEDTSNHRICHVRCAGAWRKDPKSGLMVANYKLLLLEVLADAHARHCMGAHTRLMRSLRHEHPDQHWTPAALRARIEQEFERDPDSYRLVQRLLQHPHLRIISTIWERVIALRRRNRAENHGVIVCARWERDRVLRFKDLIMLQSLPDDLLARLAPTARRSWADTAALREFHKQRLRRYLFNTDAPPVRTRKCGSPALTSPPAADG
ncbi:MAG: hypothetical protein AAFS07_18880 [Pseudomonadota bacterium]